MTYIYHLRKNEIVSLVNNYPCTEIARQVWYDGQSVENGIDFKIIHAAYVKDLSNAVSTEGFPIADPIFPVKYQSHQITLNDMANYKSGAKRNEEAILEHVQEAVIITTTAGNINVSIKGDPARLLQMVSTAFKENKQLKALLYLIVTSDMLETGH